MIVGVNWLGDTLFMTPAIRAIRRRYPSAWLACAVPPRCRELLAGNPHVDAILDFDERAADRGLAGWWRFIQRIRAERVDHCFLLHRSMTRALCVALAGVPQRIGYATWKRRWLLTTAIPPPRPDTVHKVDMFLALLAAVGIPSDGRQYDLVVRAEDRAYARQLLSAAGCDADRPAVALHAGANWHLKRWPPGMFARVGDLLTERFGARVLLIGSSDDRPMAEGIARRMQHPPSILAGQTTLPQLAALLGEVGAVISNDSGPLHIAAAVGTKTVGLFGPTKPELTAPPPASHLRILFGSVGCPVPCYRQWCPINLCLRQITPERVLDTLAEWPEWRRRLRPDGVPA